MTRYVVRGLLVAVFIALVPGGYCLYRGISASIHAEYVLHAALVTTELLNEHVTTHEGQWPRSWNDLEALPPRKRGMFEWPKDSADIQKYVTVDFAADPQVLARRSAEEFDVVRPVGTYYPFSDYGIVQTLIDSLRKFHPYEP